VSQRIAAHKSRKGWSTSKPEAPVSVWTAASSRAAQAAARVAARYAQAPSYSQMQAAEAHAAAPVAESAAPEAPKLPGVTPVAPEGLQATATPRTIEPERSSAPVRESAVPLAIAAVPISLEDWESDYSHGRYEADLRLLPLAAISAPIPASVVAPISVPAAESESRPAESASYRVQRAVSAALAEKSWQGPAIAEEFSDSREIKPVEPDQPIHANLIEFPRELVATRKMRPRRAEGPFAAARPEMQLSIFEVDPDAIATYPESACAAAVAAWPEPAWAAIELEPQLHEEAELEETTSAISDLHLAPLGLRLLAALADGALVAGVVLGLALVAASRMGHPPAKIVALCAVSALLLAGLLYHTLLLILAGVTPGMKLAGVSLCTFDGQIPTQTQLRSRAGALLLSLVPVGLGIAWALFDDDRLSWHDRLSKTYLRKN